MEAWSEAQSLQPQPASRTPTLVGEWQEDGREMGTVHMARVNRTPASPRGSFVHTSSSPSSTGQKQPCANMHTLVTAVWAGSFPWQWSSCAVESLYN